MRFRSCCLLMLEVWATKRVYRKSLTNARLGDNAKYENTIVHMLTF